MDGSVKSRAQRAAITIHLSMAVITNVPSEKILKLSKYLLRIQLHKHSHLAKRFTSTFLIKYICSPGSNMGPNLLLAPGAI